MVVRLNFGDFLIDYLFVGIFDSWVEPSSHLLEHLYESLFSKLMIFYLRLTLQRLRRVNTFSFELVEELHELHQFIGVFNEISLDDECQEFNQHKVFGIEFADCIVDILYDFFIVG